MHLPREIVLACCLVAFALRLGPAFQNRFQADEALYASWAMQIASGRDALLAGAPVDKPPLSLYAMAAGLFVVGRTEIGARLANLIASVVSVALAWRLARTLAALHGAWRTGALAALLMALSPFNIAFAGTTFLDPLMVVWGLASCVAAARGRAGLAGVCLGLAGAAKVQGLLFAPLTILTAMGSQDAGQRKLSALTVEDAVRFAAGFGAIIAAIFAWSLARGGTPFWAQQAINYGGIRLAFAAELAPRLSGWLGWMPYLFGMPMTAVVGAACAWLALTAVMNRPRTPASAIDLLLLVYVLGFFGLHWLLAFPVWDRYLLILVPVLAVLADRAYSRSQLAIRPRWRWAIFGAVALLMLPDAIRASRSEFPIGGDHGPHDGIDRVAAYLRDLPAGTVLYDHWLGWEFDYYLWDAPLYRAYVDTPADLANDLRAFGRTSARHIVLPAAESTGKIERAIAAEGYSLTPVLTVTNRFGQTSFVVYQIAPQ